MVKKKKETKTDYCECTWSHYDCFAYDENEENIGYCKALSDCTFPERDDCPFYKKASVMK